MPEGLRECALCGWKAFVDASMRIQKKPFKQNCTEREDCRLAKFWNRRAHDN